MIILAHLMKLALIFFDFIGRKAAYTLLIIGVSVAAYYLGKLLLNVFGSINKKAKNPKKIKTINTITLSMFKYIIYFVAAFTFLKNVVEVDLAALITVAGVGGVAIAFGSQALVKDAITGMFIFIEGQFYVGDVIEVKAATGEVLEMGFRVTKIKTEDGNILYIPNSEMGTVKNISQKI